MANERQAPQSDIKILISKGLEQGYLTYAEVNDHLPDDMVDPEQIEDIIGMINGMGIEVHEIAPDAETLLLAGNSGSGREVDDTAAEEAAATLSALDAEGGRTTDPVRMYMREMGTVELLTREGEIAIAKRIEEGLNQMRTRFIENDNSFLTITGSGEASGATPDNNRGWFFIPAELFAEVANQGAERFTGALTGDWRPAGWLTTRATFGYDVVNRNDFNFFPTGKVADYLDNLAGVIIDNRFQISQTTVDLGGTARFQLSPAVGSKTSVGGQFFRDLASGHLRQRPRPQRRLDHHRRGSQHRRLVGHRRVPLRRSLRRGGDRAQGAPVRHRRPPLRRQQRVRPGLQRHDLSQGQRLVAGVGRAVLQHASFINTLRLRGRSASAGSSRAPPTPSGSLRRPPAKEDGAATTGITFGNFGNPDLKPERSREFEVGADAGFFKDRVTVELTYYNKRTKDALILRPIAGSAGTAEDQFFNLGRVKNSGWELRSTPASSTPPTSPGT